MAHNSLLTTLCPKQAVICRISVICVPLKMKGASFLKPSLFGLNVLNLHQIRNYGLYIWNFIYYFVNK